MKPVVSEDDFLSLLQNVFKEAETAFAVFHSYEELNRLAVNDQDVSNALQPDAFFWNVCRVSLQTTLFMTLGRVFDTASDAKSFPRLLNATIGNLPLKRPSQELRSSNSGPSIGSVAYRAKLSPIISVQFSGLMLSPHDAQYNRSMNEQFACRTTSLGHARPRRSALLRNHCARFGHGESACDQQVCMVGD